MILHIAPDEKFIDMGFRVFEEVYQGNNKLVLVSTKDIKFVKTKPSKKLHPNELKKKNFLEYIAQFDAVILHSLFSLKIKIPKNIPVAWVGFGFDYYGLICDRDDLLLPDTLKTSIKVMNKTQKIKNIIKDTDTLNYIYSIIFGIANKKKIINQIKFFAPVLNSEYEKICLKNKWFSPDLIDWNYGTLEDDLIKGFEGRVVKGQNVLIGNSARYTNNHVDIFPLLKSLNCNKFIFPLSYGYSEYQSELINLGNVHLEDRFMPLTSFMPMEEYTNILLSCSYVIMNHLRQEALGTIVVMLYLGAKVFLREKNPIYSFFKSEGVKIYSIEELEKKNELLNVPLSFDFLMSNRAVLKKHWSRKIIHKKTKKFITKLVGESSI